MTPYFNIGFEHVVPENAAILRHGSHDNLRHKKHRWKRPRIAQGLSLGLVDAANLGGKLPPSFAAMPESLLDTLRRLAAARRPSRSGDHACPGSHHTARFISAAMRDIVTNFMQFDDVNRFIGEMVSGLFTRYHLGLKLDDVGRLIGDKPIGRWLIPIMVNSSPLSSAHTVSLTDKSFVLSRHARRSP